MVSSNAEQGDAGINPVDQKLNDSRTIWPPVDVISDQNELVEPSFRDPKQASQRGNVAVDITYHSDGLSHRRTFGRSE